jgi:predicted nucleotidyltransferase
MEASVRRILSVLKRRLEGMLENRLARLVLFGSRARGDYDQSSDIDVAIIVRGSSREDRDRILREVASLEFEYCRPLSTLVLSEEELEHLRSKERALPWTLTRKGSPFDGA